MPALQVAQVALGYGIQRVSVRFGVSRDQVRMPSREDRERATAVDCNSLQQLGSLSELPQHTELFKYSAPNMSCRTNTTSLAGLSCFLAQKRSACPTTKRSLAAEDGHVKASSCAHECKACRVDTQQSSLAVAGNDEQECVDCRVEDGERRLRY